MKDPKKRLGHESPNEVKNHSWFSEINWKEIENKKVYIINIKNELFVRFLLHSNQLLLENFVLIILMKNLQAKVLNINNYSYYYN